MSQHKQINAGSLTQRTNNVGFLGGGGGVESGWVKTNLCIRANYLYNSGGEVLHVQIVYRSFTA